MFYATPETALTEALAMLTREHHVPDDWTPASRTWTGTTYGFVKEDTYRATCTVCGAALQVCVDNTGRRSSVMTEISWINHVRATDDARQIFGCPSRTILGYSSVAGRIVSRTYADGHTDGDVREVLELLTQ